MPGKSVPPARSFSIRLSRTSSWTLRRRTSPRSMARRRSPSVEIAEGLGIPGSYSSGRLLACSAMGFFERGRRRVFAHRGGSALAPENTLAAFELGLRVGADGLELDVHLSADGVPVVL